MTLSTEQIIGLCTAVTGLTMAIGRYVFPFIIRLLGFRMREDELKDKVFTLETNHLAHLKADIERMEKQYNTDMSLMLKTITEQGQLLARIDERTRHLK